MSAPLRQKIERVSRELIKHYLDLFVVLLAERGNTVDEQRAKIDLLVRCLGSLQIEPSIFVEGRRIPMVVEEGIPPMIKLNAEMFSKIPQEELLFAFTKPISQILDLPLASVGLVLQGREEKQLRNLYHSAKSRLEVATIHATSVLAVIEHRVTLFVERLRGLVFHLSDGDRIQLPSPASLIGHLTGIKGTWPEWIDVSDERFATAAVAVVDEALSNKENLPDAATLMELCWESLDLSVQSFMRHVGRALRNKETRVEERLLVAIAEVIAPQQLSTLQDLDSWPSMADLKVAWEDLFQQELITLGEYYQGGRIAPMISAFAAPRDSLGLREPVELPFDYPLVCWSVREVNALRDMLQGFTQAHLLDDDDEFELLLVDSGEQRVEPPMALPAERRHVEMQVIGTNIEIDDGYQLMQDRAWMASTQRLMAQFRSLEAADQLSALQRVRGVYDGFFMGTKHVWERRLNGWEIDEPIEAFRRMTQTVRDVLACDVFFDPFESPMDASLRMIPTFCFVVALNEHLERVPFKVPISSLIMTAATGSPPLIVRMVDVPGTPLTPCRWMCDRELTMQTMQGHPVQLTLRAVSSNMLRMLAYE